jgi:type IV pilus assembly protein PilA
VSEAAQTFSEMPTAASVNIDSQQSRYVASVAYTQTSTSAGIVTAYAQGDNNIAGQTVTLNGTYQSNGQVIWVCGGSIASKYMPSSCK